MNEIERRSEDDKMRQKAHNSLNLGWQQPTRNREKHREKDIRNSYARKRDAREDARRVTRRDAERQTEALETYPWRQEHWKPTREEPDSQYAEGA
jgi:hypothetical protein